MRDLDLRKRKGYLIRALHPRAAVEGGVWISVAGKEFSHHFNFLPVKEKIFRTLELIYCGVCRLTRTRYFIWEKLIWWFFERLIEVEISKFRNGDSTSSEPGMGLWYRVGTWCSFCFWDGMSLSLTLFSLLNLIPSNTHYLQNQTVT